MSRIGSIQDQLGTFIGRVCDWWWDEFREIAPAPLIRLLVGRPDNSLIINSTAAHVDLINESSRHIPRRLRFNDELPAALADACASHQAQRGGEVGIALPAKDAFTRSLVIPSIARKSLSAVLSQDLHHKTPFNPDDIVHGHTVKPATTTERLLHITHVIVRRDIVDRMLKSLGLPLDAIDFVKVHTSDGCAASIYLRDPRNASKNRSRAFRRFAIYLALILFAATGVTTFVRQGIGLDRVEARLDIVKPEAERIAAAIRRVDHQAAALAALRRRRQEPSISNLLEELSKILPDDSWLQSVQIDPVEGGRRQISIAGYSQNAAKLVPLFDASGGFESVALTSAVAVDPVEQRERFTLKAYSQRGSDRPK